MRISSTTCNGAFLQFVNTIVSDSEEKYITVLLCSEANQTTLLCYTAYFTRDFECLIEKSCDSEIMSLKLEYHGCHEHRSFVSAVSSPCLWIVCAKTHNLISLIRRDWSWLDGILAVKFEFTVS